MFSEYLSIFRNRNFLLLWTSQITSQFTVNIMNFILLLDIFNKTGSTVATSFLWISYALPAILIGPLAAVLADLVDRKKILVTTNFAQATIVFLYAISNLEIAFLPYVVIFGYSLLNQFYFPAEMASVPSLVQKDHLPHANGLFFITQQVGIVVGYVVAGILIRIYGFSDSLYFCVGLLVVAGLSVSLLPSMKELDGLSSKLEKSVFRFFRSIYEGYKFIRDDRKIFIPFLLLLGLQIVLTVSVVNVPLIATQILDISVESIGINVVAPTGIGAGIAAIFIPKLMRKGVRKIVILNKALELSTLSLLFITLALPLISHNTRNTIAPLFFSLLGASFVSMLIPLQTYFQERTPVSLRGRLFGNFWFLATFFTVLPLIGSGVVTELFGIKPLMIMISILAIIVLYLLKTYKIKLTKSQA